MNREIFEEDINQCLQVLKQGGIILYPTDTVWGLGCDATNETAVQKIYEIKRRPAGKSMIVLLAGEKEIKNYVAAPPPDISSIILPGKPTTVIYSGALGIAPSAIDDSGSVAIRIVKEAFCYSLIRRLKKPIISTSANFSGMPAPAIFSEIDPALVVQADYVVKYRQDDNTRADPSSIIKLDKAGNVHIIRS